MVMSVYLHITEYGQLFSVLISLKVSKIFYLVESVAFLFSGLQWYCTLLAFLQLWLLFTASSQPLNLRVLSLTPSSPFFIYLFFPLPWQYSFNIHVHKTSKSLSRVQTALIALDFPDFFLWMSQWHIKFNFPTTEVPIIPFNWIIFQCALLRATSYFCQVP